MRKFLGIMIVVLISALSTVSYASNGPIITKDCEYIVSSMDMVYVTNGVEFNKVSMETSNVLLESGSDLINTSSIKYFTLSEKNNRESLEAKYWNDKIKRTYKPESTYTRTNPIRGPMRC